MDSRTSDAGTIPFTRVTVTDAARAAADRVLGSGWVTTGPEVLAFEAEFAATVGASEAVAVSSCTAAIELGLRALRLPPNAKVLTSAMTFCSVAHAIVRAGHRPVLVDVDHRTMMPTPHTVAESCARIGGADAMVALHFAGHPAPVFKLAEAAGLPLSQVIEDAAHGPGIAVGDRQVGSISAATCFSFYATKNLPIGEGGMLTTDDAHIAKAARSSRLHGMSQDAWRRYLPGGGWRYDVETDGLKANMTDLQAAIGRCQLEAFPAWQLRRRELVERYRRGLSQVPGLGLPGDPVDGAHAWHLFVIQVEDAFPLDRDDLMVALGERGINCSVHFIPLHHHSFFRRLDAAPQPLPGVEDLFSRILSLPLYPELRDAEVDRICDVLAELAKPARRRQGTVGASTSGGVV